MLLFVAIICLAIGIIFGYVIGYKIGYDECIGDLIDEFM